MGVLSKCGDARPAGVPYAVSLSVRWPAYMLPSPIFFSLPHDLGLPLLSRSRLEPHQQRQPQPQEKRHNRLQIREGEVSESEQGPAGYPCTHALHSSSTTSTASAASSQRSRPHPRPLLPEHKKSRCLFSSRVSWTIGLSLHHLLCCVHVPFFFSLLGCPSATDTRSRVVGATADTRRTGGQEMSRACAPHYHHRDDAFVGTLPCGLEAHRSPARGGCRAQAIHR